jgi:polar amino acid transport system substrate-binding protein
MRVFWLLAVVAFGLGSMAFVAQAQGAGTMLIGSSYSAPFSTPQGDGYFDLVLEEAFVRVGREVEIRLLPAERSLRDADSGRIDGDIGRIEGIEVFYPNLRMVPEPALDARQFVAFTLDEDIAITGWKDLAPYNLAFVRGWKIFEENTGGVASRTMVESTEQLFVLLDRDRADIVLSSRIDGLAAARAQGLRGVRVLDPPLAEMKMYLYLNDAHAELLEPLARALSSMKADGTCARIMADISRRYIDF